MTVLPGDRTSPLEGTTLGAGLTITLPYISYNHPMHHEALCLSFCFTYKARKFSFVFTLTNRTSIHFLMKSVFPQFSLYHLTQCASSYFHAALHLLTKDLFQLFFNLLYWNVNIFLYLSVVFLRKKSFFCTVSFCVPFLCR